MIYCIIVSSINTILQIRALAAVAFCLLFLIYVLCYRWYSVYIFCCMQRVVIYISCSKQWILLVYLQYLWSASSLSINMPTRKLWIFNGRSAVHSCGRYCWIHRLLSAWRLHCSRCGQSEEQWSFKCISAGTFQHCSNYTRQAAQRWSTDEHWCWLWTVTESYQH